MELADSWWDWINWRDIGYQGTRCDPGPRHVFRARPQRRHLEAGLPEDERRRVARAGRRQHRTSTAQNGFGTVDDLCRRPQRDGAHRAWRAARDDQPGRKARHPYRTTRHTEARRGPRSPVHARFVPRADGVTSGPVVALHPRHARPLRPEPGIPPVRPRGRHGAPAVRYPNRPAVPRRRRAVSRTGPRRQLLPEGQRPRLPGARCDLHPGPVVQVRPGPRDRDPGVRKGSGPEHDSPGGQVPRRRTCSRRPTNSASR